MDPTKIRSSQVFEVETNIQPIFEEGFFIYIFVQLLGT